MSIRAAAARVYHGALTAVHRRPVRLDGRPALVTFTFDDFPRSAYQVAGSILRGHGARGTYYAAASLMGSSDAAGDYFGVQDLLTLVADGHELGSHTFGHVSARSLVADAYGRDIRRGMDALRAIVGPRVSASFSYPFGEVTLAAKRVAGGMCQSCRGTLAGANGPLVDLNLLRANRLYSDSVPLADVARVIHRHVRPGRWLIFYTHDVQDAPSRFGCTPRYFEEVLRAVLAARGSVVTAAEALAGARWRPTTGHNVTVEFQRSPAHVERAPE